MTIRGISAACLLWAALGVAGGETARDIAYASIDGVDSSLLSLDVHWEPAGKDRPLLIYVHGGSWSAGDKRAVAVKPEWAFRHGYVFASVNYRLTPKAKFPAHAEDVAAAVAWMHRNAKRYGGDPARIFLVGHSAGSHLVALVATDERYLKAQGLALGNLTGVVALDTLMYDIPLIAAKSGGRLAGPYRPTFGDDPALWNSASPILHVKAGKAIPPIVIPYSAGPMRKETADRFAARLQEAGVPALVIPTGKTHGQINQEFGREDDFVTRQAFEFFAKHTGASAADPLKGDRLREHVRRYASFGEHRTATPVDVATGDWLAEHMRGLGYQVQLQEWTTPQFFLEAAGVTVEGARIDGFPLWIAKPGVKRAALVAAGSGEVRGKIVYFPSGAATREAMAKAEKGGAAAAVYASGHDSGEILGANVPQRGVQAMPKLQVRQADAAAIERGAARGAEAEVRIEGRFDERTRVRNVVARLDRGGPWIVISTPYSGWFQCAGERGSGLAIWLGLAERMAQRKSKFSYLLTANSGHELGFAGGQALLDSGSLPKPAEVRAWVHFGASVAVSRARGEGRIQGDPRLNDLLSSVFGGVMSIRDSGDAGELGLFRKAGYLSFGLIGSNSAFHTKLDGMESIDAEVLERVARATARALDEIEEGR